MRKQYSIHEKLLRDYKRLSKKFIKLCKEENIEIFKQSDSLSFYVCVYSPSDYDLGEKRDLVERHEKVEKLFCRPEDYEKAMEIQQNM